MESIIHGLSNEAYHNQPPYTDYLSSSQLKLYGKSPKAFKFALDNPTEEKSEALRFGSLFHDLMACFTNNSNYPDAYSDWMRSVAIFTPPVNEKTLQSFGSTTKTYKERYEKFLQANAGKIIASEEELNIAKAMARSLMYESGATSEQVRKLLKWGKPEVSHFIEYEGCKFKWRPDLETKRKIIDWKTASTDDLSEESINRIILKYGYHISSSFYQFFTHEQTGVWKDFYLVLVSKVPPLDCVMVDMANYGYRFLPDADIVIPGPGAMEFKRLLDLHIKCTKENHWPGAENSIPDNGGVRVLEIQPPRYYSNKFIEDI